MHDTIPDRLADVPAACSPNLLLCHPPMIGVLSITIDVQPGGTVNPISLWAHGSLRVNVLATDEFDPASLVLSTIRLGDGLGFDTPLRTRPNGGYMSGWEDVNGDGRPDLVLHFSLVSLVENGDLTPTTTHLVLTGSTAGGIDVRGEGIVEVVP